MVPLVIHVGCTTAIFFHFGLIQSFSAKLGWLMKITLQTTAIESISLAANIFLSTVCRNPQVSCILFEVSVLTIALPEVFSHSSTRC